MKHSIALFAATAALILTGAIFYRPSVRGDIPRLPHDTSEVLERLPTTVGDPREQERKSLGRMLAVHPDDLRTAIAVARLDIQIARERADPRYLGYAQAALATWWDTSAPPPDVLLLRATIRQSLHDFDGALADLDRVVTLRQGDAQAWITRAVVLTVRGRYDEAMASCRSLLGLVPVLDEVVCEASIQAVTGSAEIAYDRLERTIRSAPGLSPDESEWATSTLAEIAVRLGRYADAERGLRAALTIVPDDPYVLGAYADLLLDLGRPADAAKLLADRVDNDGLLLRLALAEKASAIPEATEHAALLGARFDAIRLRGDTVHRREEARYELEVVGAANLALALARANWDVQHEPWDVRILLEAALAAGNARAAAPALAFLDEYHLQDPRIAALAATLRKASP
ncbi:MAG: tetratricopeptide repeat protein [Polyangiaceae bacterium]